MDGTEKFLLVLIFVMSCALGALVLKIHDRPQCMIPTSVKMWSYVGGVKKLVPVSVPNPDPRCNP